MPNLVYFQAGIEIGDEPIMDTWQAILVAHALWPELPIVGRDVTHFGNGVWLIPVPADQSAELLVAGLARHLEVPGVGTVSVHIPSV